MSDFIYIFENINKAVFDLLNKLLSAFDSVKLGNISILTIVFAVLVFGVIVYVIDWGFNK